MSWQKESILVLVEAAPNWSDKYGSYLVCTGGITESNQWRRALILMGYGLTKRNDQKCIPLSQSLPEALWVSVGEC